MTDALRFVGGVLILWGAYGIGVAMVGWARTHDMWPVWKGLIQ